MNNVTKSIWLALLLLAAGCASNSQPKSDPSKVEAIESPTTNKLSPLRMEIIKQTARGVGAQGGLAWKSRHLNLMLEAQRRNLDHIFNFNYLVLNQNVMPPVLTEGRNTLNLSDDLTLRISDREYQIVQPPRFVTTPPNWRNYIWMAYQKPELPNSSLLPQSNNERKMWNEYISIGWNDGLLQADQIFKANLSRLQRDFEGMILYRKLLAQNMITAPYVSQANLGVTGNASNIHINDRVLRVSSISQLNPNSNQWEPILPVDNKSSTIKSTKTP